ncbi:MAG: LysM peptidoglycan-binding domain-containing protein [Planctomycetota bacterium]
MGQLEKYGLYVLVVVIVMILGVALMGGDPAVPPSNELALADIRGAKPSGDGSASTDPGSRGSGAQPSGPGSVLFPVVSIDDGNLGGGFIDAHEGDKDKADPRTKTDPSSGGSNKAKTNEDPGQGGDKPIVDVDKGRKGESAPPAPVEQAQRKHVIAQGDTPSSIAQQYYGDRNLYQLILDANPGLEPTRMPLKKEIVIPARVVSPKTTKTVVEADKNKGSAPLPQGARTHTIAESDTLSSIAKTYYGAERFWQRIKDANPDIDERRMPVGRTLIIPAAPVEASAKGQVQPPARDIPKDAVLHRVEEHETLTQISRRYYHSDHQWQRILDANPGLDANRLRVGSEIVIPAASADRSR